MFYNIIKFIIIALALLFPSCASINAQYVYSSISDMEKSIKDLERLYGQIDADNLPRKPGYNYAEKILHSAASIIMETESGERYIGSGTFVNTTRGIGIITAKHVVMGIRGERYQLKACAYIYPENCTYLIGDPAYSDEGGQANDWLFYQITHYPLSVSPAIVRKKVPRIGEKVYLVSRPHAGIPWVSVGNISYIWFIDRYDVFAVDGFAFFGSSGGGVYNSDGEMVGLISAIGKIGRLVLEDKVFATPIAHSRIQFVDGKPKL